MKDPKMTEALMLTHTLSGSIKFFSKRLSSSQFSKYLLQPSSKLSATPLAILSFFTLKILLKSKKILDTSQTKIRLRCVQFFMKVFAELFSKSAPRPYLLASSIATATATVIPTMGLLPAPMRPIISLQQTLGESFRAGRLSEKSYIIRLRNPFYRKIIFVEHIVYVFPENIILYLLSSFCGAIISPFSVILLYYIDVLFSIVENTKRGQFVTIPLHFIYLSCRFLELKSPCYWLSLQ